MRTAVNVVPNFDTTRLAVVAAHLPNALPAKWALHAPANRYRGGPIKDQRSSEEEQDALPLGNRCGKSYHDSD